MKLYHYSKDIHPVLMSKAASGAVPAAEVQASREKAKKSIVKVGAYCDHISFFFSPIPAFLLPKLFPADHAAWAKGTKLYEHVVDTKDLPYQITYEVVESAKRTALYDQFVIDHNWTEDDPNILEAWLVHEMEHLSMWDERGTSRTVLERKIHENMYSTSGAFLQAAQRADREENKYKYASCVPHVMIYPPDGKIRPSLINSLVMGNEKRTLVIPPAAL